MDKTSLLTLLLLLSLCGAHAQANLSPALDRLEQYLLITGSEKKSVLEKHTALEKTRKQPVTDETPDYSRQDQLLGLLVEAKTFSTSGTSSPFIFMPAPASTRNLSPIAIRTELDTFIQRLDRAGLLSDHTRTELNQMNARGRFGWQIEAAQEAFVAANEEYFLRPDKLKKFADQLRSTNVMSKANYRLLMEKSRQGRLHRYSELPPYLGFCTAVPFPKMLRDTMGFLRALYTAAASSFPGLRYDSIAFRVEKDKQESQPDFEVYNLETTIRMRDIPYTYSGFYYAVYKNNHDTLPPLPEHYYTLFNKVLEDKSSPYRLHSLTIGKEYIGLIALTEEEFQQFTWSYDGAQSGYMQVSYENYTNKLTQQKIRAALKTYDSLGLFSHLSPEEKDSCMTAVTIKEINYYSDILKCFKNLVLDLDLKYGIDSGQYAFITRQVALISKGAFQPDKIIDGYAYEHPDFTYGFTLNSKTYSAPLHQDRKWLDPGFWDLIERAEKENNPNGQFYYIHPSDGLTEIYLTNEQYKFLQSHQLLEFTDPDIKTVPSIN